MTVMVTRRTVGRTHLLRPDPEFNAHYLYCLGVLAERHAIQVHSINVMSTHEHLMLTDVRGQLPRFLQELHRTVALGVKVLRKWDGPVWDHEKPSVVELRTTAAIIEKTGYLMANPVAAGLVYAASDWPGITTRLQDLGRRSWTVARPNHYFDPENPAWPETVTLTLAPVPVELSQEDLRAAVQAELRMLERQAREQMRAKGWHFVGPARLARLSPYARAKSKEPLRARNPTFAVGRGQREAFERAVIELRAFRQAYRAALQAWRCGLRNALFPAETWLMHWLHGAPVAP